jgi:hypothetical protein
MLVLEEINYLAGSVVIARLGEHRVGTMVWCEDEVIGEVFEILFLVDALPYLPG